MFESASSIDTTQKYWYSCVNPLACPGKEGLP